MLADVTGILRQHQLSLPSDLALLVKAFISLEGMGRGLDPDFNMATEALPQLEKLVRAQYKPAALARRGWASLQRALQVAEQLPYDLSRLLRTARRGRLNIAVEVVSLRRVGDQLDRAASRLSVALVIAALIIGSSIVMTVDTGPRLWGLPALGLIGFVSAVLGALWLLRSVMRSGHTRD